MYQLVRLPGHSAGRWLAPQQGQIAKRDVTRSSHLSRPGGGGLIVSFLCMCISSGADSLSFALMVPTIQSTRSALLPTDNRARTRSSAVDDDRWYADQRQGMRSVLLWANDAEARVVQMQANRTFQNQRHCLTLRRYWQWQLPRAGYVVAAPSSGRRSWRLVHLPKRFDCRAKLGAGCDDFIAGASVIEMRRRSVS